MPSWLRGRQVFMIFHVLQAHDMSIGMHTDRLKMKLLMRERVLAQNLGFGVKSVRTREAK